MITPTYTLGTTIKADDINLELQDIDYPEPIIEGKTHNITILIKNTGDQAIPAGKQILDQLYINTVTNPLDENSTNLGLSAGASRYLNLSWTPSTTAHTLIIKLLYDGTETHEAWIPITVTEKETDLYLHTLTITDILFQQPIKIHANTTNTGKKTTKTIKASLFINQKRIQNITIVGLEKNQSHNFTFTWTPSLFGYHTVNVTIDPDDKITESNENNNYQQKTIFITPYQIEWYQPNWHYRKSIVINGTGTIALPINFTHLLEELDLTQTTFENNTIVPIIYNQDGSIKKVITEFTFTESSSYNPQTNANGILIINITQDITYLTIYFDVKENNNTRTPSTENTSLTPSGNLTVADNEQDVEGWWSEINLPENNFYPLNKPSDITAITQAYANEVRATLYHQGSPQEILDLSSTDLLKWQEEYTFNKEGNWTINLQSIDTAGYRTPLILTDNLTIQAIPDLYLSYILLPENNITEGNPVDIHIRINNTKDADAENYTIRLYIAQEIMQWDDSNIQDTILVSIEKEKSKTFTLTWETTHYGPEKHDGNWIVGIWIITDTTHPDLNTLNNKATIHPLHINKGDQTPPTITLGEIPSQLEIGNPIIISATIRDTSGIQSANISIINPEKTQFEAELTKQSGNQYTITYTNTFILGKYRFTITAIDASIYHNKTQKTGTFTIIEDATSPEIYYSGVFPHVQLLNTDVTITCITSDLGEIALVELTLNHPDGFQQDINLIQVGNSEKYQITEKFSQSGKYTFNIQVQDESKNTKKTKEYNFWITTDLNDTDNDGMPDNWEERYDLNPYDHSDATKDLDGDGKTNLEEYKQQTNPTIEQTFAQQFALNIENNSGYLAAVIIFTIIILFIGFYTFKWR